MFSGNLPQKCAGPPLRFGVGGAGLRLHCFVGGGWPPGFCGGWWGGWKFSGRTLTGKFQADVAWDFFFAIRIEILVVTNNLPICFFIQPVQKYRIKNENTIL